VDASADGDDLQGKPDDEDGLTGFLGVDADWSDGGAIQMAVKNVLQGDRACVYAWVDWAGDGFGVGSDSTSQVEVTADDTITMNFPDDANMPESGSFPLSACMRLRVVDGAPGSLAATGGANGSEVEDHKLSFQPTAVSLASFDAPARRELPAWPWLLLPAAAALALLGIARVRRTDA
jgi:hypothetical protein